MAPHSHTSTHFSIDELIETDYWADGDGPKTEPVQTKRTWYGKRKKLPLADESQPVPQVKHRKYARIKKILNIGEKLKPLGIGDDASNYDGQADEQEEEDDESAVPPSHHLRQDGGGGSALELNLRAVETGQDLYVQVYEARGLQGLDSNGKSDPYTKIHVGHATQGTKIIEKDVCPEWNETFVFTAKDLEHCLRGAQPRIVFDLYDADFLSPDEFLGEAHIDLSELTLQKDKVEPMWLDLHGEKHGKQVVGLGEVLVAVWTARSNSMDTDRIAEIEEGVKVSSLCNPPGTTKSLPVVIHTEGNCLYEEPCIYFLSLHIGQVRDKEQINLKVRNFDSSFSGSSRQLPRGASDSPRALHQVEARPTPFKALNPTNSGTSFSTDIAQHSEAMALEELQSPNYWQGSETGSGTEDSETESEEEDDEDEEHMQDDGDDPFDEGEVSLENPLQTPAAENESGAPSSAPLEHKRLFFEASFGNQRRRSKIARLKSKAFSWNQGLPFAAALPISGDKHFKLLLCEVDRERQMSRLLAVAYIPLLKLLKKSQDTEKGHWYRLHDYSKRCDGRPLTFGAVQLKLNGADSDKRRVLYKQSLIQEPANELHEGRSYSTSPSISSKGKSSGGYSRQNSPDKASPGGASSQGAPPQTSGREPGEVHVETSPSSKPGVLRAGEGNSDGSIGAPRRQSRLLDFSDWVGEQCGWLQRQQVAVESSSRILKPLWLTLALALLLFQAGLAIVTLLVRLVKQSWQRYKPTLGKLAGRWRRQQEPQEDGDTVQPPCTGKSSDRPLGMAKFVIKGIDLKDQPYGAYFLVFKCGPHWGQSSLIKGSKSLEWKWEIQLPLHEPHSILLLNLFKDQQRRNTKRLTSNPPHMVGKLRLRLNTLAPGHLYASSLPMLADRKEGGRHTATANMQAKILYLDALPLVKSYFEAAMPSEVYALGLAEGNIAKQLDFEYKRLCMQWLKTTNPAIPRSVARDVMGMERQQFVFSRAKANWTRSVLEKERFTWIMRFWRRNQQWENPAESISLMCGLITFSFYPQVVIVGLILTLVGYSLLTAPKRPNKPQEMYADPEEDDEEDEVEEKGGIGQLRKKYVRLVKVALTVQNMLEDFADTLERMHAFINWADPRATLIFIFICLGGCLAIAAFSLPVVLSLGLCWTVRPPFMRSPTPPSPLSFFLRLPTRSDQII